MDEEFEKAMQKYSEININPSKTYEVPQTIQDYKDRIKANESLSIFDSDFYTSYAKLDNERLSNATNDNEDLPFPKENVLKISSGRGRGVMNRNSRPGTFSNYNDIKKDLQRIAPLGYSNEITELTINSKNTRSKKNFLNIRQCENIRSTSTSKEKLENSQPSISKILQTSKKQYDSAYRTLVNQKEQQMSRNSVAIEHETKQLVENDCQQFNTDLEKSYEDSISTNQRTETGVKSDFVFGKGLFYDNKLNLKSSSDFPSLSGRKKM